jgi:hypothetical protein
MSAEARTAFGVNLLSDRFYVVSIKLGGRFIKVTRRGAAVYVGSRPRGMRRIDEMKAQKRRGRPDREVLLSTFEALSSKGSR